MAALAATLLTGAAAQAHAGKRGVITGLGIGVGAAILLNELSKEAQRQQRRREKPRYSGSGEAGYDRPAQRAASNWMTPSDVTKMQSSLNVLGYDAGEPDGRGGQQTAAAVRKFQANAGDRVTGVMTPAQFVSLLQQAQTAENAGSVVEQGVPSRSATPAAPNRAANTPAVQPTEPVAAPSTAPPASSVQSVQERPPSSADDRGRSAPSAGSPPPPSVPQTRAAPKTRDVAANPTNSSAGADGRSAPAEATQAANPALPKISADGKFTEHRRNRQVKRVFEHSSAGRRVAQEACAAACLEKNKCQAYASYPDGRCELGEEVGEAAAVDGAELAVIGVRRSVEAAAAP